MKQGIGIDMQVDNEEVYDPVTNERFMYLIDGMLQMDMLIYAL